MNRKKIILFILMIAWMSFVISALGISPGRTTFNYHPGMKKNISVEVINNEHKDISVIVFARGELSEFVNLKEKTIEFTPNEGAKKVNFTITLPKEEPSPGLHELEIVAIEVPQESSRENTLVGSQIAVISQVQVFVPYPGKYLEKEINIIESGTGEKTVFLIPLTNKGKEEIKKVSIRINISSENGKIIKVLNKELTDLKAGERKEAMIGWDANVRPGRYIADLEIFYDGKTLNDRLEFNVGEVMLEIKEMYVEDFSLGEIAKFEILLENKWPQKLNNVHLTTFIYKDGKVVSEFSSPVYDIEPLSNKKINAFWDSKGVLEGEYDGKIIIRYGEKRSIERKVKILVSEDSVEIKGITGRVVSKNGREFEIRKLLIIIIVFLVIMNIFWFLIIRKVLKNKSSKNERKHKKRKKNKKSP